MLPLVVVVGAIIEFAVFVDADLQLFASCHSFLAMVVESLYCISLCAPNGDVSMSSETVVILYVTMMLFKFPCRLFFQRNVICLGCSFL